MEMLGGGMRVVSGAGADSGTGGCEFSDAAEGLYRYRYWRRRGRCVCAGAGVVQPRVGGSGDQRCLGRYRTAGAPAGTVPEGDGLPRDSRGRRSEDPKFDDLLPARVGGGFDGEGAVPGWGDAAAGGDTAVSGTGDADSSGAVDERRCADRSGPPRDSAFE